MQIQSGLMPGFFSAMVRWMLCGTLLLMAACVTTTNAPEKNADLKKAEETHVSAGESYLRQRDKDAARRHFTRALSFNSNSAGAHNGMAMVYQLEQDPSLAEKHYRLALQADSKYSQGRYNYGLFLLGQQRYDEASRQLQAAADDVNYLNRHAALAYLGVIQLKQGDEDKAMQLLKQAVGIQHRLPLAHLELANLYFDRKDYSQAKFHYEQFNKMSRQNPRSLWLGIRLERIFGDKDKQASYALALKNLYPYSEEYLLYKQSLEQ